jgi:hypothetical protein
VADTADAFTIVREVSAIGIVVALPFMVSVRAVVSEYKYHFVTGLTPFKVIAWLPRAAKDIVVDWISVIEVLEKSFLICGTSSLGNSV